MKLSELTYPEARRDAVVLLPIGATEAHGPHLPLGTDCIIAEEMARRAAERLDAVVAPTIAYARTDFAAGFAGTVTIGADAFEAHLSAVVRALGARVCLVNAHIEPAHLESLRRVAAATGCAFPDKTERTWRHKLREVQGIDGHAGAYETALVMAARPELVRELPPDVTANLGEAMRAGAKTFEEAGGAQAYFGSPRKATRELGDRIYAILVEMIVTTCSQTWPGCARSP